MTTCANDAAEGEASAIYQFPASFAQQRLWLLDQVAPGSAVYHIVRSVRFVGPLDVWALEQSLEEVVRRHESLRTTFTAKEGRPMQVVHPALTVPLPLVDLHTLPGEERESAAFRLTSAEANRPFVLSNGPLLRTTLLRLDAHEHILVVNIHHIIADEWSMGVFMHELAVLYTARVAGTPTALAELPIQYADFAAWQRERLQGEALAAHVAYWKQQLSGAPAVLELPTDRPRLPMQTFRGAVHALALSPVLTQALRGLSRQEGSTLFMTLLAAFQVLLHHYTGQDDVVVGSPIAGRTRTELEQLIGFFANTLVLRGDLSGDPGFRELLGRVRATTQGAYAHQDLPFERLVEEVQPERHISYNPLFQVMFVLQNVPARAVEFDGLTVHVWGNYTGTAKFDVTLFMVETAQGLIGVWEYNTDLFDASTIARLSGHFCTLLEGIVADPDQRLSALPLITEVERVQLVEEWNATQTDYPRNQCLPELFEAQVDRRPDAVAIISGNEQLTYGELNRRANRLAHYLRKRGVGPEVPVALCMERSPDMVMALLGILKAGGAYVPLDPAYPVERLAVMLRDVQATIVLTQERLRDALTDLGLQVVVVDDVSAAFASENATNPVSTATAKNLAYVTYTSGSTGRPRGVQIEHRAVARLLLGTDYVQLDAAQTILHMAPMSFDASTFEVWGALLHGGRCVLYPDRIPTPGAIGRVIAQHRVTTIWLTASLFNAIVDEAPDVLASINQLLIGGEALSVAHVRRALAALPSTTIINGYGPTESTTFTTCYRIPRRLTDTIRSIPIGRPIGNTQVYILNDALQPVPIGAPGELYIGGDGLARGYINLPELTAKSFIPHPFSSVSGTRLYKTGDWARYLSDGNIEFLGRIDQQVKIRGFRIELGEIEFTLHNHPSVRHAVVLARSYRFDNKHLVAYVVPADKQAPSTADLQSHLTRTLPEYMVPSNFVFLDALPLTPNGKVDHRALPSLDQVSLASDERIITPATPLQHQLAEIWSDLLNVRPIGMRDNFFHLGGHSLLAARLIDRVEGTLGRQVSLSTFLSGPTIEHLAEVLEWNEGAEAWHPVVAIRSGGAKRPFFFWHGDALHGGPYCWHLARYLDADQPFYAMQAHGLDGQTEFIRPTIEEMAADYIDALRTVQPQGPYLLGGFCSGGFMAYEVAQRLQAQGQQVDLLILIDAERLDARRQSFHTAIRRLGPLIGIGAVPELEWSARLLYYTSRLTLFARRPAGDQLRRIMAKVQHSLLLRWDSIRRMRDGRRRRGQADSRVRGRHYWKAHRMAMLRYSPRTYSGRLTLFWTGEFSPRSQSVTSEWRQLAQEVEVHSIAGTHLTCLTTYLCDLAAHVSTCLHEAHARDRYFGPHQPLRE
jgi:aspartate racemase